MAATMKDIARLTGLGLATISKYFNGGTVRPQNRILIEEASKKLHFIPNDVARSLKTRQTRTIGVVIPELSNSFITTIISSMEDILRSHDYAVIVCDCRSDVAYERDAVSFLLHKRVDGLINMPIDMSGSHLLPALQDHIPVVLVDRLISSMPPNVGAVIINNEEAAYRGTSYLTAQGHQKIGLILGTPNIYTTTKRMEGYLSALQKKHLPHRQEYIHYGNYTLEGGYKAVKALLALPERPTALFVTNYEMTLGAVLALNEAGLNIPGDLSLLGFDKMDLLSAVLPDLSTLHQPYQKIGEQVAMQILELLQQPDATREQQIVILDTELYEGNTIRPLENA